MCTYVHTTFESSRTRRAADAVLHDSGVLNYTFFFYDKKK